MKTQLMTGLLLLATSFSSAFAMDSKELLNEMLLAPKDRQQRTPIEVNTLFSVGNFLKQIDALNSFPYGDGQPEYIRKLGIHTLAVNFRKINDPSTKSDVVAFTKTITFSKEGLVTKVESSVGKDQSVEISYDENGIVKTFSGMGLYNNFSAILSTKDNISLETSYSGRLDKKIVFNKNYRLEYLSRAPLGNVTDQKYTYDDAGNLLTITDTHIINKDMLVITQSVQYNGLKLSGATIISATGYDYFAKSSRAYQMGSTDFFASQSYVNALFPSDTQNVNYQIGDVHLTMFGGASDDKIHSSNVAIMSPGKASAQFSEAIYDVNGNIESMSTRQMPENRLIGGAVFTRANDRITQLEVANFGISETGLIGGVYNFKYNHEGQAYRVEITPPQTVGGYLATVNSELTTYSDN